jgi:hypothetical protein
MLPLTLYLYLDKKKNISGLPYLQRPRWMMIENIMCRRNLSSGNAPIIFTTGSKHDTR